MSQPIRGQGRHLVFWWARKTQTWQRTWKSCFLSSLVEFRSAVSEEKSKMSHSIRCRGGHLVFPIGPKNTNLVEDVEILLPVKFVEFRLAVSEEKSKMLTVKDGRTDRRTSAQVSKRQELHIVYISYGTVSWCPLHFCHTCSFSSIQPLLVLLDRLSGFAIFTCGFIIIWHRPMVYVASPSSLSILHHHPCSADSHLAGFTFATMSCWVDLVVLPQIHVDSLSFSTVSWYLWHVHHCWPMHSMSHFHCIMIIMAVVLWTRVVYKSYGTVSWCPLHFCHTCSFNPITLCAFGQIKWFCHIHVWFYYHLASSHGVCGISIFFVHIAPPPLLFVSFVTPPLDDCYIYL